MTAWSERPRSPGPAGIAYYSRFRASFHQPLLPLRRCVAIVRNLLHVDLPTTVVRSRGNPLDLEVSELGRVTLATFEIPEILDVNAGEYLSTRSPKYIVFIDPYLRGGGGSRAKCC